MHGIDDQRIDDHDIDSQTQRLVIISADMVTLP